MTKIRLTRLLVRNTHLMQREDHVWQGFGLTGLSRMSEDGKDINYITRSRGPLGMIFDDEAAIQMFLDDNVSPLDEFVNAARKYRNSMVMTVAELFEYASYDGSVIERPDDPLLESLRNSWVTSPPDGMSLLSECSPAGLWDWFQTLSNHGAYRFERFTQYADALISLAHGKPLILPGGAISALQTGGTYRVDGDSHLVVLDEQNKILSLSPQGTPTASTDPEEFVSYLLEQPQLTLHRDRHKEPTDRAMPLDVLAAHS